ncbi:MAG: hypothetical protein WBA22_05065 [Candidatus Methanofastidiosia archaeon]
MKNGRRNTMNIRMVVLGPGLIILMLFLSTWTPVVKISTHEANNEWPSRNPHMGIDAEGNTYVVWEGYTVKDSVVFWTKVDSEGNPGTVMKLSDGEHIAGSKDYLVDIAVDRQGNSYVTWTRSLNNDSDVYWVRIDPSGMCSEILNISCDAEYVTNNNWNSQIAIDAQGNSYVVWQGFDGERDSGSNADIYWVKINDKGETSDMAKISTHGDNKLYGDINPQIAVDRQGNSHVIWQGCDKVDCWKEPGDFEIYWVRVSAQGVPGIVKKIPPTDPDNVNTLAMVPQIAVDGAENSYIVWSGQNRNSFDVYWVKISSSGKERIAHAVSQYADEIDRDDFGPRIILDNQGNSYITWQGFDGNDKEIYWIKIDASEMMGRVVRVSNYVGSSFHDDPDPEIAVDGSGNSYIVWESFNFGVAKDFDHRILWVKVNPEGEATKVKDISKYSVSNHFDRYCEIAVTNSGKSYVVWEGEDESKQDHIFLTADIRSHARMNLYAMLLLMSMGASVFIFLLYRRRKLKSTKREKDSENKKNLL